MVKDTNKVNALNRDCRVLWSKSKLFCQKEKMYNAYVYIYMIYIIYFSSTTIATMSTRSMAKVVR